MSWSADQIGSESGAGLRELAQLLATARKVSEMAKPHITKTLANLILAAKDHTDALIEARVVSADELKYVFANRQARAKVAKQLSDEGMSARKIAALTGVSRETINKDLRGNKLTKNGKKLPPEPDTDVDDACDLPDESDPDRQVRLRSAFLWRAQEAIRMAEYDDLSDVEVDDELAEAAKQVVMSWSTLAALITERLK